MKTERELREQLHAIDHKSYPLYKTLKGSYRFPGYAFTIAHVQGDPFAAPSDVCVEVVRKEAGFSEGMVKNKLLCMTLADQLLRGFYAQAKRFDHKAKGSGKSGLLAVKSCGQEVLEGTSCEVTKEKITLRFEIGFPANGRTINARELEKILFDYLPECVKNTLFYQNLDGKKIKAALELAENQQEIREQLRKRDLVAFVADGAILPRESGISSRPMKEAIPFKTPESLRVTMELPHKGKMTGMGIPRGITLIVGGGYHGKSTLLNALELGVYPHIAGDGREYVITDATAVKLRSEDGRFIKNTDISMFINHLPNGKNTTDFSTDDASGSTSQAAGVVESIEAGSKVLLLDEDTSATNFMVRDAFMQQVVSAEKEPITPFLARARELFEICGISTILVAGSSGAFFHIADTVIQMDSYVPLDITEKTKKLCAQFPVLGEHPASFQLPKNHHRMEKEKNGEIYRRDYRSGAVKKDSGDFKLKTLGKDSFSIGRQTVDLRYIEQLTDAGQTAYLGQLLKYAIGHFADGKRSIAEVVELLKQQMDKGGMGFVFEKGTISGGYTMPREQEIFACFFRYRT